MTLAPLMSVDDVAAFTGLSPYTIRQAVREGELPAAKIRGRIRIDTADALAWIDGNRIDAKPASRRAQFVAPPPPPRTRPPAGRYVPPYKRNAA